MAGPSAVRNLLVGGVIPAIAVWLALSAVDARASEESVDRATKAALSLDARPDRGASQFDRHCARCHGREAQGDAHGDENLVRFLGSIDDQDLQATADYLSRLHGPGAVHEVMRLNGVVVD